MAMHKVTVLEDGTWSAGEVITAELTDMQMAKLRDVDSSNWSRDYVAGIASGQPIECDEMDCVADSGLYAFTIQTIDSNSKYLTTDYLCLSCAANLDYPHNLAVKVER